MEAARFLVGGQWRSSAASMTVVNPYDGTAAGAAYCAGPRDLDDAIAAACSASAAAAKLSSWERHEALRGIANGIAEERDPFARLITRETGKPISFARAEVDRAILTFTLASEEARRMEGTVLPLDFTPASRGKAAIVRRFPIGPIAAITPFNFPLNLVAHKLGPAVAAGNPVVLKPSSHAPLTALRLGELFAASALPTGMLNIVPCSSTNASQLVTDERVKLVTFTGSPAVGWGLKSAAGKKRVTLELGGNAGVIVDRDADLGAALPKIVSGSFGNAGQSCIAVQRVFVHADVMQRFTERFVALTQDVRVGDPSDEATVVGPMIDEAAAIRVEQWINEALKDGARTLCGGNRRGAVLEPTIVVDVHPEMKVCAQEVFAPVVTLESFEEFTDVIARVNVSAYGLQAGVFTNDLQHAFQAFRDLQVGGVLVNDVPTFRMDHMPYGGVKDSGFGREGLRYAIEEMTELKLLALPFGG